MISLHNNADVFDNKLFQLKWTIWINDLFTLEKFVGKNNCDIAWLYFHPCLTWLPWAMQCYRIVSILCCITQGSQGKHVWWYCITIWLMFLTTNFANLNGTFGLMIHLCSKSFLAKNICDIISLYFPPYLTWLPWVIQCKYGSFYFVLHHPWLPR